MAYRMIPQNKQEVLKEMEIDNGYIVTNSPIKPDEPICLDTLARLQIKYNQAAVEAYVEGPNTGLAQGSVIATGVTSITSYAAKGGAMVYESYPVEGETANIGEIKILDNADLELKYYWNDGGIYKIIEVDLTSTWAIKTNAEAVFDTSACELNGVTVHTATPAKSDYKSLFRWSLGDFQVAELDSEEGYKTL